MKSARTILTLIISVMALSMLAFALGDDVLIDTGPLFEETVGVTPGNINDDGVIDENDVVLLANMLTNAGEGFTHKQLASANLYTDDDNGSQAVINIKDLICLAQLVSKIENGTEQN